jgi:glycerophosphoryl diester phosphodiesterase
MNDILNARRLLSRRYFIGGMAAAGGALLAPAAFAGGLAGNGAPAAATSSGAAPGQARPLVFAHRGASALRPEHTLASYAKAIVDGADYVEPDLVCTKDGVLVARHDAFLSGTTDVSRRPEFASRRTRKTIDGETHEGWFVDDFTLAELKTLRAIERIPQSRPGSAQFDDMFQVVTFEEIIDFVAAQSAAVGRVIGLVPELKSSSYFARAGLPLEDRFFSILAAHDYTRRNPVEIQSFEVANLKYVRDKLGRRANVRLMQLVGAPTQRPADVVAANGSQTFGQMITPAGLKEIAAYADVVAPPTRMLIPLKPDGRSRMTATRLACAWRRGPSVPRTASSPPTSATARATMRAIRPDRWPRSSATCNWGWTASSPTIRRWVGQPSTADHANQRHLE